MRRVDTTREFVKRPDGTERASADLYLLQETGKLPTICLDDGRMIGHAISVETSQGVNRLASITIEAFVYQVAPRADVEIYNRLHAEHLEEKGGWAEPEQPADYESPDLSARDDLPDAIERQAPRRDTTTFAPLLHAHDGTATPIGRFVDVERTDDGVSLRIERQPVPWWRRPIKWYDGAVERLLAPLFGWFDARADQFDGRDGNGYQPIETERPSSPPRKL